MEFRESGCHLILVFEDQGEPGAGAVRNSELPGRGVQKHGSGDHVLPRTRLGPHLGQATPCAAEGSGSLPGPLGIGEGTPVESAMAELLPSSQREKMEAVTPGARS